MQFSYIFVISRTDGMSKPSFLEYLDSPVPATEYPKRNRTAPEKADDKIWNGYKNIMNVFLNGIKMQEIKQYDGKKNWKIIIIKKY